MADIIDFTELQKKNKAYAGANGSKISILYDGEQYMLKFPPQAIVNKDMSYSNSYATNRYEFDLCDDRRHSTFKRSSNRVLQNHADRKEAKNPGLFI